VALILFFALSPKYSSTTIVSTTTPVRFSSCFSSFSSRSHPRVLSTQTFDNLFVGRIFIGIILAVAVLLGGLGLFIFYIAAPVYAKPLDNVD
jgi:hypothetical protein